MVSPSNVSLFPSLPSFLSSSTSTHALHVYPFVSCYLSSLLFHLSLSQISSVLFSSSSLLTLSSMCNLCLPSLHTATKLKILHFTFPLSLFHLVFFYFSLLLCHPLPFFSHHTVSHLLSFFFCLLNLLHLLCLGVLFTSSRSLLLTQFLNSPLLFGLASLSSPCSLFNTPPPPRPPPSPRHLSILLILC